MSRELQLPENSFLSEISQPFQIANKVTILLVGTRYIFLNRLGQILSGFIQYLSSFQKLWSPREFILEMLVIKCLWVYFWYCLIQRAEWMLENTNKML